MPPYYPGVYSPVCLPTTVVYPGICSLPPLLTRVYAPYHRCTPGTRLPTTVVPGYMPPYRVPHRPSSQRGEECSLSLRSDLTTRRRVLSFLPIFRLGTRRRVLSFSHVLEVVTRRRVCPSLPVSFGIRVCKLCAFLPFYSSLSAPFLTVLCSFDQF